MKLRITLTIIVIMLLLFGTAGSCKEDVTGIVVPTPCITIVVEEGQ
jgi:hypothetical protein